MRFIAVRKRFFAMAGVWAASVALAFSGALHAQLHTHTPDANTVHLFHFNEAVGASSAANSGSSGVAAISFDGTTFAGDGVDQPTLTTLLGSTGFAGFGNAANVNATTVGFGVDFSGNGAYRLDDSTPVTDDRLPTHASIMGAGNAFTLEAMINVPSITVGNREIIASDSSLANNVRGFQFRINATGSLEFNFIAPNTSAVLAAIPTTGPHAFVANEWFHAALSYDGTNARLYWTKVDPSFSAANLIGGPSAEAVDISAPLVLTLGTDARVTSPTAASNEGLGGLIDEVRISNVSRGAAEFIFGVPIVPGDVDGDQVADIDDFNIIKMNLFKTGQTRQQGDLAGGDGLVDFADYRQWKNVVAPAVAASASLFGVPEPSTLLLLALGGMFLGARRRHSLRSAS